MSEIKWAYNEQTGSFSALPASPFLLLALLCCPFLMLLGNGLERYRNRPKPLPENFDPELYKEYALIYKRLKAKQDLGKPLDYVEGLDWQKIRYPPWRTDHHPWVYH